jgi:hypothetical protein
MKMVSNMIHTIIANSEAYQGRYVTLQDWDSQNVVSVDACPVKAYREARDKGIDVPVLIYVPLENESIHIP